MKSNPPARALNIPVFRSGQATATATIQADRELRPGSSNHASVDPFSAREIAAGCRPIPFPSICSQVPLSVVLQLYG